MKKSITKAAFALCAACGPQSVVPADGGGVDTAHVLSAGHVLSGDDPSFGTSLALDQNSLAVGVPGAGDCALDGTGNRARCDGAVEIYALSKGSSALVARLMPPAEIRHASFGAAVALQGSLLVVGAPDFSTCLEPSCSVAAGRVLVYRQSGNSWNLETVLVPAGLSSNSRLGVNVAISPGFVLANSEDGIVVLYAAPSWSFFDVVTPPDPPAEQKLFLPPLLHSLAFSDGLLGVSANADVPATSTSPSAVGTLNVFKLTETMWQFQGKIEALHAPPSGDHFPDMFGMSVAIWNSQLFATAMADAECPAGQLCTGAGALYSFDASRAGWKSPHREQIIIGPHAGSVAAGAVAASALGVFFTTGPTGCDAAPPGDACVFAGQILRLAQTADAQWTVAESLALPSVDGKLRDKRHAAASSTNWAVALLAETTSSASGPSGVVVWGP